MDINSQTVFCGVIGNPVEHSLSPAIHNAAFQSVGFNGVYLAWRVEAIEDAIRGLRALGNFRGASVTIPHKISVLPCLDEVDATARHIGAVNTIVCEKGRLFGSNTDATGALRALREAGVSLQGSHVVVLGSGGAARAIAFALSQDAQVSKLTLLGIDEKERSTLAHDLRAAGGLPVVEGHLDESTLARCLPDAQVLIHCTPIGMSPKPDATCVPPRLLHARLVVMDIVYNPRETRLLLDAARAGCQIIPGLEMFLNQAVAQFELWTNRPAPVGVMRRVLEDRFR